MCSCAPEPSFGCCSCARFLTHAGDGTASEGGRPRARPPQVLITIHPRAIRGTRVACMRMRMHPARAHLYTQTDQERAWLVTRRWAVRCLQRSDPLRRICAGSDWSEVRQRSSWSHVLAKQLVKSMIRWFSWLYHCGNHDQSYQSAEEILVKRTIKPNNKKEKKKKKAEIALVDCKLKFGSNFLKSPTNESHFLSF